MVFGKFPKSCRAQMLDLVWTWRVENWVAEQGGLLNSSSVEGERITVPS